MIKIAKIVSGGQIGADRGGLDAAIELRIPHGGWTPKGRLSEDGTIPEKYQLVKEIMIDVITEVNGIRTDSHKFVDKKDLISLLFYPDLEVACGTFRDESADYASDTMEIENPHHNLDPKKHFIVRASGDSMDSGRNPIKDGDLLLLELNTGGTISNQVFAIEYQDEFGETAYVLKRIEKIKQRERKTPDRKQTIDNSTGTSEMNSGGETPLFTTETNVLRFEYKLVSANSQYDEIPINPETMFPFARFKCIL